VEVSSIVNVDNAFNNSAGSSRNTMQEIGSIVASVLTSVVSADLVGVTSGLNVTASGIVTSVTSDCLADVGIIVSI